VNAQLLQVKHMVGTFKRLITESDQRLGLDGRSADLCLVICDIRHQGRAKYPAMQAALASPTQLKSLLELGSISYPERIKTLTAEVAARSALLTAKHWSRAAGDFK